MVIVCVISKDNERVLLGRQAIWPKGMYSCLAGFVEPGESLEEAARREVKEESGIRLGHVRYHSSQPWPFPNSLMMGCHAEAVNENVDITQEDKELEDAKWFTRAQILEALRSARGSNWGKPSEDGSLRLSPPTGECFLCLFLLVAVRCWCFHVPTMTYFFSHADFLSIHLSSMCVNDMVAIAHHILKAWATEEGEIPLSKM